MAGVGVVDRDMQGEVGRIDAELVQLVSGDRQVQRQLFVAEVEADHLGQPLVGMGCQSELQGALQVLRIGLVLPALEPMGGEQLAVQQHMVALGPPIAELFHIDAHQIGEARVLPVAQDAVQPAAVDELGGGYAAQKMKRMRAVAKEAARRPCLALGQIVLIALAGRVVALAHPCR